MWEAGKVKLVGYIEKYVWFGRRGGVGAVAAAPTAVEISNSKRGQAACQRNTCCYQVGRYNGSQGSENTARES